MIVRQSVPARLERFVVMLIMDIVVIVIVILSMELTSIHFYNNCCLVQCCQIMNESNEIMNECGIECFLFLFLFLSLFLFLF